LRRRKVSFARQARKRGGKSRAEQTEGAEGRRQNAIAVRLLAPYLVIERVTVSDSDIDRLESRFPEVSGSAFGAARERTLEAGLSVLESENGVIYELFPDGRRLEVRRTEPSTRCVAGRIYKLR